MSARAWTIALAVSSALAGTLAPSGAEAQSLIGIMAAGRWAVGSPSNCAVPRRSYWLTTNGNTITWRDGLDNIDVEAIVDSSPTSFSTITVESFHGPAQGGKTGTRWRYQLMDRSLVRVTSTAKRPFFLARCRW